jgi:hypothetical protein
MDDSEIGLSLLAPVEPPKEDGRKSKKAKTAADRLGPKSSKADKSKQKESTKRADSPVPPTSTMLSPRDILENSTCLSAEDRQVLSAFFDPGTPKDATKGVVMVKVSENVRVGEDGGKVKHKEYVRVNYETGEWEVLRKTKPIAEASGP